MAVIIGVPALWWMSLYAPVTLFEVHGTSKVTAGVCGQWETTIWPDFGTLSSEVVAVDGIADSNLWIGTDKGDILRGDGRNWHGVQTIRATDGKEVNIQDLDVRDDNDVWVVGEVQVNADTPGSSPSASGAWRSAVFHWAGEGFKEVTVPGLFGAYHRIASVAAISEDDVWFVGTYGRIWHWNGNEVVVVEPADPSIKEFDLKDISAISRDDVWVVGTLSGRAYSGALVAHWDGKEWKTASEWRETDSGAQREGYIPYLWHVLAFDHDDVWATGGSFAIHWDGHEWKVSEMPNFEDYGNVLFSSITGSASNDIWAVGYGGTDGPHPFVVHWDGTKWSIIAAPRLLNIGSFDAAKALPGKMWTSGSAYQDEDYGPVYAISAQFTSTPCP
jgi:hypothetical protein